MEIASASEAGAQPRNEDACRALPELGLFLVCDGLGPSQGGGERASRMVVDGLAAWAAKEKEAIEGARTQLTKAARSALQDSLVAALQQVSRDIFLAAGSSPGLQGICSSIDALLLLGSHALAAHVGSGRIYLARQGELHQLTEDHTQLAHLRRIGKLSEVPAAQHAALAKRLTRAVGFRDEVQADLLEVELEAGDRFVLMTDGVWLPLGEERLENLALAGGAPQALLSSLHAAVAGAKGRDNFTTLVVDPPPPPEAGAVQKIKMLGNVPAFQYLGYKELIRVVNTSELLKVPGGQTVWTEGDPGEEMVLILTGGLDVVKNGQRINSFKKGDVVGEMSMIDAAPRSASVVSTGPTNLLAFPRESLFALFREEPDLAVKFLWGVTMEMNKRLRMASNQLVGRPEKEGIVPSRAGSLPFLRRLG